MNKTILTLSLIALTGAVLSSCVVRPNGTVAVRPIKAKNVVQHANGKKCHKHGPLKPRHCHH